MGTTNKVYEQLKQLEITASNKNFKVDFSDTGTFGHSSKRQYAKLTTNSDKLKFLDRQLELNDTFLQGPLTYGGESKINLEERHELLLEKTRILDEVTQEKMTLDLASHTEAMQNNKLAYGSPKNNKNEIFGNKEIVSDAAPLTFATLPSMQVSEEQISSYVETLETEKSKVEINTNNADYTSNVGDELISKERGIQYQEIGHGAGYVEPIKPINPEKDAASEVFMSNYNDDQVYGSNLDEALNNEILKTSNADLKETVINAEEAKAEEQKKVVEKHYQQLEEQRVSNLAAMKQLGLSDDNAPYVQDKEKGTYETDNMTVYRPAEIEFENEAKLKAQKIKDEIQAEKDQAIADKLAFQDRMMNKLPGDKDIAGNNNYFATSGQELVQGDIKEAMIDQEVGMNDVIAGTTAKDMTTTVREIEAERAKKEANLKSNAGTTPLGADVAERVRQEKRIAEEKAVQGSLDDEQSTNAKKIEEQRIAEAKRVQRSIDDEQKIMGAQNQLISEGPSSGRGSRGKFRKLQAEKNEAEKAKRVADIVDKKSSADNLIGHKTSKSNFNIVRGDANDPYSFTTLAYPPDAVNSQENGHFMLFYVNVQDKTKYHYDGLRNGQRVKVGDYIERPGYFENPDVTNVPPSLRGANKYISSLEASGLGANAGTVDYQRQIVKNGGPGNILYNNMAVLSKGRKPKSGINSRYPTTTRITDSVALYLPSGIGNTTSASYGDFQTGVAGYLAMSGLDIVSELRNRDFQGAAEKIFGVGGTLITEAAKKLAVAGIETFTGSEGIQQSIDKAFGQTLNPYIEVAFNSTGMRTFDYTFKFAPKSRAETDEVKAIIQLFRFHMLPEMKTSAHRYLTLPSTFDIHYMWQNGQTAAKENSFYNKIATCVLTNVDVNFTPNGEVQSFDDGAPTQIDMNLSFKETEMMTKQHIQEGF